MEVRYSLEEVLDWESKETLRQTLTDQAEMDLGLQDQEGEMKITVEGVAKFTEFVVTFVPSGS